MRYNKIILGLLSLTAFLFTACSDDDGRVTYPYSAPELSGAQLSVTDNVEANDSLYFSINIHDPKTPLSTLEVQLISGETVISKQTIRTKGYDAELINKGIFIPFEANAEDNSEAKLVLTAINVEGSETVQTFDFHIMRPVLPEQLYMHFNEMTVLMTRSDEDPDLYVSEELEDESGYPMEFTGKISTSETLTDSKIIWGASEESNAALLTTESGAGFSFDYRDWVINQVTFNAKTFELGVVGYQSKITIKGVDLVASGGYFHAQVSFTEGEEFEITGIEAIDEAYNRDFFSYNAESGKFTFLRKSGTWDIYYSTEINYIWVVKMSDTAPTCFWMVGHGFTCAPVWNEKYNSGGWDTEDVSQMAYVVAIGNQKYQTTVFLNDTHEWGSFEIEIYSDREWGKDKGILLQEGSLSGDITGIKVSGSNGITNDEGFVPGYFRLTFDVSAGVGNETLTIERLAY